MLLGTGCIIDDIDNLSISEIKELWLSWQQGIWGSLGQATRDYYSYCQQFNTNEILIASNSVKAYRMKSPVSFENYSPELFRFSNES